MVSTVVSHFRRNIQVNNDPTCLGEMAITKIPCSFSLDASSAAVKRPPTSKMMILVSTGKISPTKSFLQCGRDQLRVPVIFQPACHIIFQSVDAGRGHKTGLPHTAAKDLPYPPGFLDQFLWPISTLPTGVPSPLLRQIEIESNTSPYCFVSFAAGYQGIE
jgi:hypothetical protein